MKIKKEINMQEFVFIKKVSLGYLKKSAVPGQVVKFAKNYAMFQSEKVTDLRDFDILKKNKFLIPISDYTPIQTKVQTYVQNSKNRYGFQVKQQNKQTNVIPLSNYVKATDIDQSKPFVEQDGIISQKVPSEIHVLQNNIESNKVEQAKVQDFKQTAKELQIKKTEVLKNSKSQKKTEIKKTTKVAKKQKAPTSVRGMKIIKE